MEPICPTCGGKGTVFDPRLATDVPCRNRQYHGGLSDPRENTEGRAHTDGHVTERAAATRVIPRTGTQRMLVLTAIETRDPNGITDEEISVWPGISDTAHRTRRKELVDGGWVMDSGRTGRTESGSDSILWILTPDAREELSI